MKKRILAYLAAAVFALSLTAGCASKEDPGEPRTEENSTDSNKTDKK